MHSSAHSRNTMAINSRPRKSKSSKHDSSNTPLNRNQVTRCGQGQHTQGYLPLSDNAYIIRLVGSRSRKVCDSQASPEFLTLPSKDITDRFASELKVLPVSTRCCPACHEVVQYLIERQNKGIVYPGSYSKWSAAALPPWVPRMAGLRVVTAAKLKLHE
jgi:hypothetical protein